MADTIKTWADYKNWVETVIGAKKDYYYRGQRDPSWKLQTTFHRHAEGFGYTLLDYLNHVIPEAHYHICAYCNEIFDLQKPDEFGSFLALVQHHGFPTPLLDWTLSPYIAAYFAFREVDDKVPQTDNVKIFIFDFQEWTASFQQPLDLRDTKYNYISVLRPYARHNLRLIPQRGAYTVTNVSDMEAHLLDSSTKSGKTFLYQVILPVSERTKVMRDLHLMGINEMTLFPSMEGVCRTLKEQFFSRDIVGPGPSGRAFLEALIGAGKRSSQNKHK